MSPKARTKKIVAKPKKSGKKAKKPYWRESRGDEEVRNFIAEWRKFRGFKSQTELAKKAGMPSQTLCRLENFSLAWTFLTLEKLSKALDVPPGLLISVNPLEEGHERELRQKLDPEQRKKLVDYMMKLIGENN